MKIYLTGFMGSGKTLWGKALADEMEVRFIDLDHEIESDQKQSIPEIFAESGEEVFRKMESEKLKAIDCHSCVIATGGGCLACEQNMSFALQNGIVVYLNPSHQNIVDYLKNNKHNRPLIQGLTDSELNRFVGEKLSIRNIQYKRAHYIIDPYAMHPSMYKNYLLAKGF